MRLLLLSLLFIYVFLHFSVVVWYLFVGFSLFFLGWIGFSSLVLVCIFVVVLYVAVLCSVWSLFGACWACWMCHYGQTSSLSLFVSDQTYSLTGDRRIISSTVTLYSPVTTAHIWWQRTCPLHKGCSETAQGTKKSPKLLGRNQIKPPEAPPRISKAPKIQLPTSWCQTP